MPTGLYCNIFFSPTHSCWSIWWKAGNEAYDYCLRNSDSRTGPLSELFWLLPELLLEEASLSLAELRRRLDFLCFLLFSFLRLSLLESPCRDFDFSAIFSFPFLGGLLVLEIIAQVGIIGALR